MKQSKLNSSMINPRQARFVNGKLKEKTFLDYYFASAPDYFLMDDLAFFSLYLFKRSFIFSVAFAVGFTAVALIA